MHRGRTGISRLRKRRDRSCRIRPVVQEMLRRRVGMRAAATSIHMLSGCNCHHSSAGGMYAHLSTESLRSGKLPTLRICGPHLHSPERTKDSNRPVPPPRRAVVANSIGIEFVEQSFTLPDPHKFPKFLALALRAHVFRIRRARRRRGVVEQTNQGYISWRRSIVRDHAGQYQSEL